jgi:hypothetical protein
MQRSADVLEKADIKEMGLTLAVDVSFPGAVATRSCVTG